MSAAEGQAAAKQLPRFLDSDTSEQTLIKASQGIRRLAQSMRLHEIQVQEQNLIREVQKEIVTGTDLHRSNSRAGGGFRSLFLSGSGQMTSSSNSRIDYTQMVNGNAAQVMRQEGRAGQSLVQLQRKLNHLLNKNQDGIVALKELAVIEMAAVYQMIQDLEAVPWDVVSADLKIVQAVQFVGQQTVTRCVETRHAATQSYNRQSDSAGLKFRLLFFRANLAAESHQEEYSQRVPYTEKECS